MPLGIALAFVACTSTNEPSVAEPVTSSTVSAISDASRDGGNRWGFVPLPPRPSAIEVSPFGELVRATLGYLPLDLVQALVQFQEAEAASCLRGQGWDLNEWTLPVQPDLPPLPVIGYRSQNGIASLVEVSRRPRGAAEMGPEIYTAYEGCVRAAGSLVEDLSYVVGQLEYRRDAFTSEVAADVTTFEAEAELTECLDQAGYSAEAFAAADAQYVSIVNEAIGTYAERQIEDGIAALRAIQRGEIEDLGPADVCFEAYEMVTFQLRAALELRWIDAEGESILELVESARDEVSLVEGYVGR